MKSLLAHGGCAVAFVVLVVLAHAGLSQARTHQQLYGSSEELHVRAADVLQAHYPAAALADADDANAEDAEGEGQEQDEQDEQDEQEQEQEQQDEEEYEYAGVVSPPPPPPPPPYSAFLQLEQHLAQRLGRGSSMRREAAAAAASHAATVQRAQRAQLAERLPSRAGSGSQFLRSPTALETAQLESRSHVRSSGRGKAQAQAQAHTKAQGHSRHRAQVREAEPFPEQSFTYKDENSPPDWLVPQKSEPAGPTTKPPPVPQMIPPPPPVPFPTYNYQDPNAAGPFSQYAPGVQGWGYDGGYAGPYDGFSLYGHPPNSAQVHGWEHPEIPRTAAQIASATAASQYHPYGAPPPLYSLGNPPPDGAASWVPVGAFLKPGTMEGGAGNE